MAKYYLGYEENEKLYPITAFDKNYRKIDEGILDVVNFTTDFKNKKELIDHLKRINTIKSDNLDLKYVLRKGKKNDYTYVNIKYGDNILYNDSKDNFSYQNIKAYLKSKKYDSNFIRDLLVFFIKDENYIYNQVEDTICLLTPGVDLRYVTNDEIVSIFLINITRFNLTNRYPFFANLGRLYRESIEANRRGIANYEIETDKADMDRCINSIASSYLTKKVNNERRLNKKNVFNLGVFISNYQSYEKDLF